MSAFRLSSFLLGLTMIFFAACQSTDKQPAPSLQAPDDSTSLRVAVLPIVEALPLYYALESGIARDLDLPLRLKTYQAQWDADTAMMGRGVDLGLLDVKRLLHHQSQGRLRHVAQLFPAQGQWILVVNQRQRILKPADLKERLVLLSRFDNAHAYWLHLADSLRLKADDHFTPQVNAFSIRLQMLVAHQADAAILPQPFAARALHHGHRRLLTADSQRFPMAFYVRNAVRTKKAAQIRLLTTAYNRAVEQLNRPHNALRDSLLIHRFQVPEKALPQLRLPRYQPIP